MGSTVSAVGTSLGYRFARTTTATPSGLRLEYEAVALGDDVPFLWAAHPQFAAPAGTRVDIDGVASVVDVMGQGSRTLRWNEQLSQIDTVPEGGSRKLYVAPDAPIFEATLVRPDSRSINLRWSAECPYVGFWFDQCQFSREPVIAIEPSTGYYDSLQLALENGRIAILESGIPRRWWVDLEAGAGPYPA